jgi:hypothetical protein
VEAEAGIEAEVAAGTAAEAEVAGKPVKDSCLKYNPSEFALTFVSILPSCYYSLQGLTLN